MKERSTLDRELLALGLLSSSETQGENTRFDESIYREFGGPVIPPDTPLPASAFATLGFEFDLNFGFEEPVANKLPLSPPAGFRWPSEGLRATDHEWRVGGSKSLSDKLTDGFSVTMDSVRLEISTAFFSINNDVEYQTIKNNVMQFAEELEKAPKTVNPISITIHKPGRPPIDVEGNPTTFNHRRTVVNKPQTDPSSTCSGHVEFPGDPDKAAYTGAAVPLVIHRVTRSDKTFYPDEKTRLWASPQATLTLPLWQFIVLVKEVHKTQGQGPGYGLTGPPTARLGLRDDVAVVARAAAINDRRRRIGARLSDGTRVTQKDFTHSITSLVTILVMYMLTSVMKDSKNRDEKEKFAKGSLPFLVKTPLWQIHNDALTNRERFILHELYTDTDKRLNLFKLAARGSPVDGTKKLFPDRTHWDMARFRAAPTWNDLVDALFHKVEVIHANCIGKKGHRLHDEILITPLSSKIPYNKTKPLIAVEMRRIGFAPVYFREISKGRSSDGKIVRWAALMDKTLNLAKVVNNTMIRP